MDSALVLRLYLGLGEEALSEAGSSSGGRPSFSGEKGWFLNNPRCLLGTYKGLKLGCTFETAFQLMLDAPSKMEPMVSISVVLDDALVWSTVLHRVMRDVSIIRRHDKMVDL